MTEVLTVADAARVRALEQAFRVIDATRMRDLPMRNPALSVEAVGFAWQEREAVGAGACERGLLGVLITPWFMNLTWLPEPGAAPLAPGATRLRNIGGEIFAFIGAPDTGCGASESCSLFSPLFEFSAMADARAAAAAVLAVLWRAPSVASSVAPPVAVIATPGAGRRAFLFGRP